LPRSDASAPSRPGVESAYFIVQYERFVAEPARSLTRLLDWLGLPQHQLEPMRDTAAISTASVWQARHLKVHSTR
jgi:hypothetical protein